MNCFQMMEQQPSKKHMIISMVECNSTNMLEAAIGDNSSEKWGNNDGERDYLNMITFEYLTQFKIHSIQKRVTRIQSQSSLHPPSSFIHIQILSIAHYLFQE